MSLTLALAIIAVVAVAFAVGTLLFDREETQHRTLRIRRAALQEGAAMLRRRAATKRAQNVHAAIEDEQCAAALEHLGQLDPDDLVAYRAQGNFRYESKLFGEVAS